MIGPQQAKAQQELYPQTPEYNSISIEKLRSILTYNPLTGDLIWNERPVMGRYDKVFNSLHAGHVAGCSLTDDYIIVSIDRQMLLAHRIAWAMHYGEWPDRQVDHINLDGRDNRISNLRLATQSQNIWNRPNQKNNTSGMKGVSLDKRTNRWRVEFVVNKRKYNLGYFETFDEAKAAYIDRASSLHGEFFRSENAPGGNNAPG